MVSWASLEKDTISLTAFPPAPLPSVPTNHASSTPTVGAWAGRLQKQKRKPVPSSHVAHFRVEISPAAAQEFTVFSRLPTELRLKIFRHSLEEEEEADEIRLLSVWAHCREDFEGSHVEFQVMFLSRDSPRPSLLKNIQHKMVCREARDAYEKTFRKTLPLLDGGVLRYKDEVIEIGNWDQLDINLYIWSIKGHPVPKHLSIITHLALCRIDLAVGLLPPGIRVLDPEYYPKGVPDCTPRFIKFFPNLEMLMAVNEIDVGDEKYLGPYRAADKADVDALVKQFAKSKHLGGNHYKVPKITFLLAAPEIVKKIYI